MKQNFHSRIFLILVPCSSSDSSSGSDQRQRTHRGHPYDGPGQLMPRNGVLSGKEEEFSSVRGHFFLDTP